MIGRELSPVFIALASWSLASSTGASAATCAVPEVITNGQVADATAVMDNFEAIADCAEEAVTPSGTPVAGEIAVFSGGQTVTGGDLTGDVMTSGDTVTTLAATGVTPGIYSNANISVDSKGRVTAASDGSAASLGLNATSFAEISTSQNTNSTSYTDLASVGPTVTLTTGTSVLIFISSGIAKASGTGNTGYASVEVSGSSSIAASDANAAFFSGTGSGFFAAVGTQVLLSGLTPGSNTFTLKYRVDGSTFSFTRRKITVIPI